MNTLKIISFVTYEISRVAREISPAKGVSDQGYTTQAKHCSGKQAIVTSDSNSGRSPEDSNDFILQAF